jgi:hypothetical protein
MWKKNRERGASAPHLYFPESSAKNTEIPEALELPCGHKRLRHGSCLVMVHIFFD